jgi:cobyrinic acid a,c-diamide synthase
MYLARNIQWRSEKHDMVGAVPSEIIVDDRPQGRGYVVVEETGKSLWPPPAHAVQSSSSGIPAHEFHYARLENLSGDFEYAFRVLRGHGIDGQNDGLLVGNLLAGFAHHRNTARDPWVSRFVEFVRKNQTNVCEDV